MSETMAGSELLRNVHLYHDTGNVRALQRNGPAMLAMSNRDL